MQIRFKLQNWLAIIGVCVLVLACVLALLFLNYSSQIESQQLVADKSAGGAADFLSQWIAADVQRQDWARVQQILAAYRLPDLELHFQVYTTNGRLAADGDLSQLPLVGDPWSGRGGDLARQALAQGRPQRLQLDGPLYLAAAAVPGPDGQPAAVLAVQASISGAALEQGQALFFRLAGLQLLFTVVVVILGLLFFSRLVIAPIRRLRVQAEKISSRSGLAAGPGQARRPVSAVPISARPVIVSDELEQLSEAFNHMVRRLADQSHALDRLNQQLEGTVVIRTRQLAERNRELQTLNRISNLVLAARTMPEAYQVLVSEISAATGFPVVAVERYDPARRMMVFEAVTGFEFPAGRSQFEVSLDATPSGRVAESGLMLVEEDISARADFTDPFLRSISLRAFVCVPMKMEGQVLGVISLGRPDTGTVDEVLTGWVETLANHIVAVYVSLKARAALAESENRFKLALEGSEVGLWDWLIPSGRVLVNATWMVKLGYPEEMSVDLDGLADLFHPDDFKRFSETIDQRLLSGESDVFELEGRARSSQGGYRWVLIRGRLMARDEQGQPLRMVGTLRDIHERNTSQENLRQRDAILEAVSAAAENFLTSSSWETSLESVIARLGQATRASRVFVFETLQDIDHTWVSRLYSEWVAEGISSEMDQNGAHVHSFDSDGFERWEKVLGSGQILSGQVNDFPQSERPYLEKMGVRSLVAAPVFVGQRWWGYIGLDDCLEERIWSPAEQDAIRLAAGILGAAIQRQQTEEVVKRLYETEREQRQISQALREAGAALSATLSFDRILDRLLDELPRIVAYDAAYVLLVAGPRVYVARQRGYEAYDPQILDHSAGRSFEIDSIPALHWLVENRQPMVIADTRIATGRLVRLLVPDEKADSPADLFRSWAAAPVFYQDQMLAIFCIEKKEPYFYLNEHGLPELLALFANQVALSLQNARLFAEALEAGEREHNLHAVTRAISSNLELSNILPNVVRLACDMAGADCGALAILGRGGDSLTYPYLHNLPEELALEPEPPGQGLAWNVINSRRSALLADYARYRQASRRWVEAGVKAALVVPVIAGKSCLGGLGLFSYNSEKRFSDRDLALVESVGRQAGVAIQNARLFEAAERRATEAEMLRQAVAEVTSALELKDVLDKILFHLERVVPYDSAAVFLYAGEHLRLMAGRNLLGIEEIKDRNFSGEDPLFLSIKRSGRPLVIRDVQQDARFNVWRPVVKIRGWMGLPLNLHGEPIGYLTLDSDQEGAFNEQDAALVQAFADEVAIAIENARLFEQVQRLAITDPLTGLYNRRYFFETARREFERALRYQTPVSLVLLDIDHFKRVNDTYGHLAGDQVLISLGQRCLQDLRETDLMARYGGEEFIFLLPETGLEEACQAAERIRQRIMSQPFETPETNIPISVSLGVASQDCGQGGTNLQDLVRKADLALYVTKETGRGRVTRWQPDMDGQGGNEHD